MTFTIIGKSQTNDSPEFVADRPGIATSPFIIGPQSFQIGSGFSIENDHRENQSIQTMLWNTTIQYGINEHVDVSLQTDYAFEKADSAHVSGLNPLTVGSKFLISEGNKFIPAFGLLFNLALPYLGHDNFKPDNLAPSIYLLMENDITDKLNICYNIGLEYDGTSAIPTELVTICLSYDIAEKINIFVENYNWFSSESKPENYFDCGITYMIRENIQLDLSGHLDLRNVEKYNMIDFGITWNFNRN